ncbi:MAG: UDP-glucose/GDP-mannose dehydrogenase family protein [Acidobacteriia bacterium]|nr:UDP-glucose/GDP-mannose dehydrogenase family protein [Terriglobia bacterium]
MKISVIGAGYVGLTTAACLAEIGHSVRCADNDEAKLNMLRNGQMPFFEPHLEEVLSRNCKAGRLQFESPVSAVTGAEAIFICVGTPPLDNGEADLSAVANVARTIAQYTTGYCLVIEKSTVPVQTGQQLKRHLQLYARNELRCDLVSNPEFLREGSAIHDFFHPDRIVIGVEREEVATQLREIYRPILEQTFQCPVHAECTHTQKPAWIVTDTNSSELIKHASNSFLAMKISFINMVADLCEAVGADVTKVALGMGMDPRIGPAFLNPGIGFGGFCFPKDVQAFVRIASQAGCDFSLLKEVENINKRRVAHVVEKVRKELWVIRGRKIAVWGLAFKPNTDDVRFAPAIELLHALVHEGATVSAYDPQATEKARAVFPDARYCASPYEAARDAEAILIVTEWEEFRQIDWQRLRAVVDRPLIFDGRNTLDATELTRHGFHYISVGRPPVMSESTGSGEGTPASSPVEGERVADAR